MSSKFYLILLISFIVSNSIYSQSINWVSKIQAGQFDQINQVEIDSEKSTIYAGRFTDEIDLDPGAGLANFTAQGDKDIFIAKVDLQGNYQWGFTITSFNASNSTSITDLILDEDDNIFVSGKFVSSADFDPGPGISNLDATNGNLFVAKYDNDGNLIWVFQIGDEDTDATITDLELDNDGNLYLGGYYDGFMVITDTEGTTSNIGNTNSVDLFLAKFNAETGAFIWRYYVGAAGEEERINGLAVDSEGRVYGRRTN